MGELEGYVQVTGADIITVTEVHKQSPEHLTIQGYKQFIKLRHQNHPLGKKGGGVACFVREQLAPRLLQIPHIDDDDEMIWIMIRPKKLPRSVTGIVIGAFYCSPCMASFQKKVLAEKLASCIDFITSKYPNVGICVTGDKNDLRIESFLRSQGLKQIVKFPTTKGNTKLDVICTNLSEYYNEPQDLPPLGGSYHYMIKWALLPLYKVKCH